MNNTDVNLTIRDRLINDIKENVKLIILMVILSLVVGYSFLKLNLWSDHLIINLILGCFYLSVACLLLMLLIAGIASCLNCWTCVIALGDESKALIYFEKKEKNKKESNRKNAIIGNVYAVISKDSQLTEIWFTEDETGWDLMQKFGWMQYKRVRKPYPSSTHDIHLVARNVEFDANLHKQLNDPFITDDERKLRREKYLRDTTADYPFSIYAVNYRLNKHLSTISVRHVDEEIYLARLVKDEFITVVKVCDRVKLSKAMTSSVYKVENSA